MIRQTTRPLFTLLVLLLLCTGLVQAQTINISGTVLDEEGLSIPGATVLVIGHQNLGSLTDLDGHFSIEGAPRDGMLRVSYVGMKTQEIPINGQTSFQITLHSDQELLDEVVVIGFGSQRKKDLTGAVSQVEMGDVLGDRPIVSASAALQGSIPGLMVSGGSSASQAKNFNIRGTLSINGGGPLVLIDNVEGDINALNPNDIESITVLKDASSAAIYGARAAGGVILVTTKRPKAGTQMELNYSFSQGWQNAISRPVQAPLLDFINAYEEAGFSSQYWAGDGDISTWKELLQQYRSGTLSGVYENGIYRHSDDKVYYLKESDILGNALETGLLSNHNVSLVGGTDKLRFRLSGNYSYTDGPMITNKDLFERFVFNSFISADLNDYFTQEATLLYTSVTENNLGSKIRDPYSMRLNNWYPEGYMPKEIIGSEKDLILDTPRNAYLVGPTSTASKTTPRVQLKSILKPLTGWTINLEYTYYKDNYKYHNYTNVLEFADVQLAKKTTPTDPKQNRYRIEQTDKIYQAINLYSNYDVAIGKHKVGAMVGYNQEGSYFSRVDASVKDQSILLVPSFEGGAGEKKITDSYSDFTIRGLFGRLTYNFDDRYLLTVNARYDGSSKFPKENRFGLFPSISGGWRIAQEDFMGWSRGWLDDFKVRASYGSIGNQSIAPYGFVPTMNVQPSNVWLDGGNKVITMTAPGLVRANYTWEKVSTLDIGYDLTAFNGRLSSSFSWYQRDTKGMLADGSELPATVGAAAPLQNIADMRTRGYEFSIKWRDYLGDFSYSIGFNLYDHLSKITKFNNLSGSLSQWYEGATMGDIWGYRVDGYYTIDDFDLAKARSGVWELKENVISAQGVSVKPGDIKYQDLDNNGVVNSGASTLSDPGDREIIGNNTSRYQFGGDISLGYKGIDLSIMLQGVGKRDYWLSGQAIFPFAAAGSDGVFQPLYYNQTNYWTAKSYAPNSPDYMVASNPHAEHFRIYGQLENSGYNSRVSDKYLQSAAYLRIKNMTLAYTLPTDLISKIKLKHMRVYASVENLATFSSLPKGHDPEILKWAYPFYRTWSIGASLSF